MKIEDISAKLSYLLSSGRSGSSKTYFGYVYFSHTKSADLKVTEHTKKYCENLSENANTVYFADKCYNITLISLN